MDSLAEPHGLTAARFRVLAVLRHEGPLPVASLARRLFASRQAVQRLVDNLFKAGLVTFEENPDHRRAKLVVPSDEGLQALDRVFGGFSAWSSRLFGDIDEKEIESTVLFLSTMIGRLEQDGESET